MNITKKLVLVRHGESKWNSENRFTGWTDIELSEKGRIEAKKAGQILKKNNFIFDYTYTSVLKRAIHTLWIILDELDQTWLSTKKTWYLNERHYGALQGLNKNEITKKYGDEQVKKWRRSFSSIPPKLSINDNRFPGNDIRYCNLKKNELPVSESLELTVNRIFIYWNKSILPRIKNNERILIVSHGNSIRAILSFLRKLNEKDLLELNIPTGIPLIFEFNKDLHLINYYYLNNI